MPTVAEPLFPVKTRTGRPQCAAAIRVAVAVCSRAVNAGFCRPDRRHAIAVPVVSKPHAAGVAGKPRNAIAPRTTAKNAAATKVDAIAAASGSDPPHRPWPPARLRRRPARASAQQHFPNKRSASRAGVPVATTASRRRRAHPNSVSVRPAAVRRYDASANAKTAAANDGGAAYAPVLAVAGRRLEPSPLRRRLLHEPAAWPYLVSTPNAEGGAGGPVTPVPRFLSLKGASWRD